MSIRLRSAIAALVIPVGAAALYASSNRDVFNQGVLPILEKHCATCHVAANPAGGLNVSSFDALLSGGKHGPAIAPGEAGGERIEARATGLETRVAAPCLFRSDRTASYTRGSRCVSE